MRLWKSIVKGSKLRPQAFDTLFSKEGSCALGAAIDGGAVTEPLRTHVSWKPNIDDILLRGVRDPVIGKYDSVQTIIVFLNDACAWSREAIAEWVRTVEKEVIQEKWNQRKVKKEKILPPQTHTKIQSTKLEKIYG